MKSLSVSVRVVVLGALIAAAMISGAAAADPEDVERLISTGSCTGCDLTDAQLNGMRFEGADLSGANLSRAQLYGSTLTGANLTGAVLDGANLKLANLTGAQNALLSTAETDDRTICPDGNFGPCQ